MALKLEEQLKEVGSKLENPPSTKDALVKLLKQAAACLPEMDQSPSATVLESMQPFLNAIVKPELLKHQDRDVKLLVATCICEITRITAPEAPYSDDILKDIFHLIVGTFSGLSDTSGPSFGRRVVILETLAKYRSCVVMLDLECDDLVNTMFSTFFTVASDDHQDSVLSSMKTIMAVLIEESEDVREDLLFIVLSVLGRDRSDISSAARRLAMNVIEQGAGKLEPGIKQFLVSSISGDNRSANSQIDHHEVIYDVYRCAPQILSGVIPYLTGELLTDQLDIRLKAVRLVGDLFSLPGSAIHEAFQPIFSEFLKRLTDRGVEVRMSAVERVKSCLLSNPYRAEASQIISALCDRLLDYDENVRKQVVDVICDVACHALDSIPVETIKLVVERLRDKSLLVKRYTMERLAEVFRIYCIKSSGGSISAGDFDWIPGKILRCFYDRDFRSDTIESVLCGSMFPMEFSVNDRVKLWVRVFSVFDKVEVKALERILEQKQRLQQEMQRYIFLRQMHQDGDAPEIQKKVLFCFRIMSRSFAEPAKAEENFLILDQLKDINIWKILTNLLDANTNFHQACTSREDLLKILGEKHRLYDFLSNFSVKCSYLLFNKEHVKEILAEAATHKSTGNTQLIQSCMDILVLLARFSPMLLSGAEEELVSFLKDDNEIIKEGALHILAKAGGTIREQLAVSSSSIDLILERLCLEGSRRQAKYAVHALAAITKDDGLKSLSVLYKRLVDMLEEKRHLPAVLQSLGCIAETAMAVFETREGEIEEFIKSKILKSSSKAEESTKANWDGRSELCLLKIYGIKTLVKSYLPVKDAQLRPNIKGLLDILRNVLLFGEISEDIESSSVDKAHMRLASAKAVLRLSKHWDHKIPIDVFHLTLRTPEIAFPQARKLFLSKVHQYIKDRLLDVKYACAFLFNITAFKLLDFEEEKQNLADIVQVHYQAKARQLSVQSDANTSAAYAEDLLPYLVHALAHHSCPNIDDCKDVKAFEPVYRQLHLMLSVLVHKDEDVKSESTTNKEKEIISAIVSIFQSIKCSEDVVDAAKSKNSHAISELGLSITKRLAQKEDIQILASSAPLPPILYKSYEKKEGDDSLVFLETGEKTWLGDENILTQLESLKVETDGKISSDIGDDEVLQDIEKEANEVPLGKIIKQIKSQGTKSGKGTKNKLLSAKTKNAGSDVDILKMVREINLDNMELPSKFESSNGHRHFASEKAESEPEDQKVKKRKPTDVESVPVPKRRRSSTHRLSSSSLTAPFSALADDSSPDSKGKKATPTRTVQSNKSDLLASCIGKKLVFTSKIKGRSSDLGHNGKDLTEENDDNLEKSTILGDTDKNDFKLSTGSMKKRKRRSISGLAKCTTKKSGVDIEELIGYKIKVWWPMDKQFYEGTVKSYDPIKRKHVILYDDGDIEVLRLEKERWELADNGRKPMKKSKSLKHSQSTKASPAPKNRSSDNLSRSKKSEKIVKGKRTPKKNLKRGQKELEDKDDSDVSNPETAEDFKGDDKKLGDSQEEDSERVTENVTIMDDSDKEVTSASGGIQLGDALNNQNQSEESDGEKKSNSDGRVFADADTRLEDAQKDDAVERSHLEEREEDESNEALREEVNKHKSDSEGDQDAEEVYEKDKSNSEGHQDAEEVNRDKSDSQGDQDADGVDKDKSDSPGDQDAEGVDKTKSDSKGDQDADANGPTPKNLKKPRTKSNSSYAGDAELSDDEPLSQWKHKVRKSASRRA
ncbi:sister chromatid cohesion protein PDS5 homolog A isoform X1 [Ricinus communis]|uniref:sister chromatid cohesion protein PDS5 homolog A isoform X1 n=1 Tax=Ricinus communis TaxID=3988 RepID=UPI000772C9BB|nr:sister chromatid cohesion protein PDS5 homolog A isoform X1 [Ricinus communis]|eukprot:XP_015583400.1 sister chromatid cohesion protein PDS5 homolog A isoform X1 [Ricinus communis]